MSGIVALSNMWRNVF